MKIGINRWTLPSELPINECFDIVKHAGFDSIEINVAEGDYLHGQTSQAEAVALKTYANSIGLEISSVSSGLGWKYPLTSTDPDVRAKGAACTRKALEIAQWLEVDTILLVPGIVNADTPYDVAYTNAQAEIRKLAPEAESRGVAIGVENVWNKFLLSPLEMARFVDEIGSTHVGVYFDAGNVLIYGFPEQWIRILGTRIKKVHVKDFKSSIGNGSGFANMLQGDVPWAKVRAALEDIGYDGYITAEVNGYPHHTELGLKHIAESLKEIFG